MDRLTRRDLRRLLAFLEGAYAAHDLDGFVEYTIHHLPAVIPAAITSYNEINPLRRRVVWRDNPGVTEWWPEGRVAFERHMLEHPLVVHYRKTGDGGAYKISDFLTQRQFHRLALYQEFFRKLDGGEYQLCVALPSPAPLVVGIGINRSHADFTERERLLLDLLRPHLVQAYRNAELIGDLRAALEATGREPGGGRDVVVASRDGRVRFATRGAADSIAAYFERGRRRDDRLPEALLLWARRQERREGGDDAPPPREPLVVRGPQGSLVVRLASERRRWLFLLEERVEAPDWRRLRDGGLTPREAEVLGWLAQGKTNAEIGTILGARPRTVGKHVERILAKLGVETRTAAAVRALERLRV